MRVLIALLVAGLSTGWIAESPEDSNTLLRPPGRAILPTVENAERLVELAHGFVTHTG